MRTWAYKINQWNVWQRSLLLITLLFIVWTAWYFLLEKPLLEKHQAAFNRQNHAQALAKELSTLLRMRANFVYKNELQAVQLKQVFQNAISGTSTLTMKSYVDNANVTLPAGASEFVQAATALNVTFLNTIQQSPATMVFSSDFNNFVTYLQFLHESGVYFDSIDFNMNRYPKAEITLKVFTLKGA